MFVMLTARWPDDPSGHAYDAAAVAAATREALIAARVPFIAETVFSHPSKLDLISDAQAAGYTVTLHVLLVPERESVQRVAHRVLAGGHDVPEEKIRSRYARLWPLDADAITRAELAHIFDNSQIDGPDELAMFAGGVPLGPCRWPEWAPAPLTDRWPR
jgi:predicted ABC-type ATPase